jgi:hypothetical protein
LETAKCRLPVAEQPVRKKNGREPVSKKDLSKTFKITDEGFQAGEDAVADSSMYFSVKTFSDVYKNGCDHNSHIG